MSIIDDQKQFILKDSLQSIMWKLSLPAIAAMVLFGLNAFMDTVYIGQLLNETALAGVAIAYPLTSMMMGLGSWAGTGAANLLSIALGKEDKNVQEKLLANATLLALITTLVFTIPAYIFAEPLIGMLGGTGEILTYGTIYFKVTLLAAPLWVYSLTLNMIIRGEGKMKEAAIMMSYGLVLNLILTPILIVYLDMGVAGAAWATNIGMLVYCIVGYLYFWKDRASFSARINSLQYDPEVFQSILKMGLPGFILTIMGLVQALVVFNAIVNNGTEGDLAFFAAANRILLFFMTPLFGLMRALQPVIGINFGAGQNDRVKESFMLFTKTGFYIVAPFWILMSIFPNESMQLVLPERLFTAQELFNLRIYLVVLPLLPVVFMGLTFFPAVNQEKYGSIIGLARQIVFYVPVMLLLPRYFGVEWVYLGATVIDIVVTAWIVGIVWKLFKQLDHTTDIQVEQ